MTFALFKTPLGHITAKLFVEQAPKTCSNFCAYHAAGDYEQTSFYRIVVPAHPQTEAACKISVAQGGPKFDPSGHDPKRMKFALKHEPTSLTGLRHVHGALSMGRFKEAQSYGGFFLCFGDQPEMDAGGARFADKLGASVFGQITDGWDVFNEVMRRAEATEFLENEIPLSIDIREPI